jgi:exopolysaccharide biosynthesis polyprenyl glycosylphosphotransferase
MSTAERTVPTPGLEPEHSLPAAPSWAPRARFRHVVLVASGADFVAVLVAQCAALGLTAGLFTDQRADTASLFFGVVALSGFWLALLAFYGNYRRRRVRISARSFGSRLGEVVHPLIIGGLVVLLAQTPLTAAFGPGLVEPATVGVFLGLAAVLVPLARLSLNSLRVPGLNRPERTLVVGSGPVAGLIAQKIERNRGYGMHLAGYLDDEDRELNGRVRLGLCADLARVCEEHNIDRVLLADPDASDERMLDLVRSVRNPSVQVSIVPRYFEVLPSHASIDDLEGVPVLTMPPVRLGMVAGLLKRGVDVAVSAAVLFLLAPALAVIAVAVRIDSQGPALFRQARRGRDGSAFEIVKFRTMVVGAEDQRRELAALNQVDGPLFKVRSDPRVTRVGAFLRRTSLDELPQFWNVLRGDMSLVGPRPFVVDEADQITGWASRRLDVRPGIAGLWQSMGRNDLSYEEMKRLDYLYVTNWSPWWDVKILARTARAVLARDGAY